MIPEVFIENWRKTVSWQMTGQIERDLIIECPLIDLYNDHPGGCECVIAIEIAMGFQ
jgi:hypothetical protein